ncbi:MAG: radical SAM protein [Eubacteriales bacterium]
MKVYFIQSTPYYGGRKLIKKSRLYFVGLAPAILAALCPDWEFECCLETIEAVNFESDADLIAISGMGHAIIRSIDIARAFKQRGKTVVMGGYMASLLPKEAKQYCDSVVIGDGERAFPLLLQDFERGQLQPFYNLPLEQLSYPLPKYEIFRGKRIGNFLPVQAGRGCPNSCSFCSVYCLYHNRYMRRDIAEVVRDIAHIKRLGYKQFLLLDDNILADKAYLLALCKEIEKLRMKWLSQCEISIADDAEVLAAVARSGCLSLSFGLESLSQESLRSMQKGWAQVDRYGEQLRKIRQAGIDVSTEMVIGADGDTLASIRQTADFITRHKITTPRFYILTPIPGTVFYDQMKAEGRLVSTDIYQYNGAFAVHQPKHMTPEQLTEAYWQLYRSVYSFKSIIKRTLLRKPALKNLFYCYVNLYYKYQIAKGITPNII